MCRPSYQNCRYGVCILRLASASRPAKPKPAKTRETTEEERQCTKKQPEKWHHQHNYLPAGFQQSERNTRLVIGLTATMMVVEIAAGSVFNSMALLADGWHMASHASALSITAFAYFYARRHAHNSRYSFGTWKVGVLGGFSSAVVLAVIALLIAWESFGRILDPLVISFDEAIFVACVGLVVNLVSA